MKFYKRIAPVFLAVAIIVQVLCMPIFASDRTSNEKIELKQQVINDLGILSINGNDFVSRGEFVNSICALIKKQPINSTETLFFDVDSGTMFADAIYTAASRGYINGAGDGNFYPEDNISSKHAALILLKVMGYKPVVDFEGGKIEDYVNKAHELKLFHALSDEAISRVDAAVMLYNALETPLCIFDGKKYQYESDNTILNYYLKLKKEVGIVTANYITSIGGVEPATNSEDIVEIDGRSFYAEDKKINDMLGYSVEYYYDEEDVIKCAVSYKNKITKVSSEDIIDYSNWVFSYEETKKDYNIVVKDKRLRLNAETDVLYNGVSYPMWQDGDIILEGRVGNIEFIDNDGDEFIDVARINDRMTYIVSGVDVLDEVISFGNPVDEINFKDICYEIYNADGNKIESIEAISANDVMSIYMSKDNKYAKIYVSSYMDNRVIKQKLSDNRLALDDGSVRSIERTAIANAAEIETGKSVRLFYDYLGNIANFMYVNFDMDIAYQYIMKVKGEGDDFDIEDPDMIVKIKMIDTAGIIREAYLAKKVKLDGVKVDRKTIYDTFRKQDETGVYYTDMQMVRMSLNQKGEIDFIDTQTCNNAEESPEFSLSVVNMPDAPWEVVGGYVPNQYLTVNSTPFMVVPQVPEGFPLSYSNGFPDEAFKGRFLASVLHERNGNSVDLELIDPDEMGLVQAVVYREPYWHPQDMQTVGGEYNFGWYANTAPVMIDEVEHTLDAYDEEIYIVSYYNGNQLKTTECKRELALMKNCYDAYGNLTGSSKLLKKGDIVKFGTDRNGKIQASFVLFDSERIDNGRFGSNIVHSSYQDNNSGNNGVCGVVAQKNKYGLKLYTQINSGATNFNGKNMQTVFDMNKPELRVFSSGVNVIVFDHTQRKVEVGNTSDIVAYSENAEAPSIVVIGGNREMQNIYVIK